MTGVPPARPGWYTTAAIMLSSLVFSVGAVVIALQDNARSERKWCSIVVTLDTVYKQTPPTTPTGVELAARMAELRQSLHCP